MTSSPSSAPTCRGRRSRCSRRSLLGFALPLASAIGHAADIVDCAIWGVIALCVQVLLFVARIPLPDLSNRIAAGEMGAALWLGFISVTAGVISSASMSY